MHSVVELTAWFTSVILNYDVITSPATCLTLDRVVQRVCVVVAVEADGIALRAPWTSARHLVCWGQMVKQCVVKANYAGDIKGKS